MINREANSPSFEEQLTSSLIAYRETWTTTGYGTPMGPNHLRASVRAHMTTEQLEAQEPEDEALSSVIETGATGIAQAFTHGEHGQAIDDLTTALSREMFAFPNDASSIQAAIMKSALDKIAEMTP